MKTTLPVACILEMVLVLASSASSFPVPDQVSTNGHYTIHIHRSFTNLHDSALVAQAEAVYPDHRDIEMAIDHRGSLTPSTEGERHWWHAQFDGVRIPYSIVTESLLYYLNLIHEFERGDFSHSNGITMDSAGLTYSALVESRVEYSREGRTFTDVYVVTLTLDWYQYCGSLCAMGFRKEKIVVFSGQGTILAVFGDGKTRYIVS